MRCGTSADFSLFTFNFSAFSRFAGSFRVSPSREPPNCHFLTGESACSVNRLSRVTLSGFASSFRSQNFSCSLSSSVFAEQSSLLPPLPLSALELIYLPIASPSALGRKTRLLPRGGRNSRSNRHCIKICSSHLICAAQQAYYAVAVPMSRSARNIDRLFGVYLKFNVFSFSFLFHS